MGGLEGPPKPPALGDAPAQPGRPSGSRVGLPAAGVVTLALAAAGLPMVTRDSYYLDVATTILMNLTLTMSFRLQVSTG